MKNRFYYIGYTIRHRKAFRKVEKELFHKVTIRGYLHDLDKVFLYLLLGKERTSEIHRKYSRHHINKARTYKDYCEMVVDWECARYTKPDKPLNAYDTLYKFYPQIENKILPILKDLGIDKSNLVDIKGEI